MGLATCKIADSERDLNYMTETVFSIFDYTRGKSVSDASEMIILPSQ
jgi:hypothetical protein